MKKTILSWLGFMVTAIMMVLTGGTFTMAADGDLAGEPAITHNVGPLDGPGTGVAGDQTLTETQEIMNGKGDFEFYQTQVNKRIVEMKMESCPIDQILRAQNRVNKTNSIKVEYYSVGQRPIASTVNTDKYASAGTTDGTAHELAIANPSAVDTMDVLMFPDIQGYKDNGEDVDPLIPLQVRVVGHNGNIPLVIALNGKKNAASNNRWDLPVIPQGAKVLRLGRAAGEKDVETASYYELPDPSFQYCQRFIMQCEQSIIERMHAKKLDWNFSRQERLAMDDMRGGIERSGLFGKMNVTRYGGSGNIWTTGGIYWQAGKDIELGHWDKKLDTAGNPVTVEVEGEQKVVYEYVITEKELNAFIAAAIKDAGNASRTKLLFVDNLIYQAFANLRSNKRIITTTEANYRNWGIDFESFSSMGTKILIYRHDSFNYMGMDGRAFLLDPRYLEKWVFGDWSRKEYDLKDLFIRNANATVMEEFSCWTLYYPNAHARVSRPAFEADGVTDEIEAA